MFVVGLTGSLATGKSVVAQMLKQHGARVLDADKITHRLLKSDVKCIRSIGQKFGEGILSRGAIDRKKLAEVVFKDAKKLKALTRIIHPLVIREMKREITRTGKGSKSVVVIDAPLLIEAGLDTHTDLVIVVKASRQKQLQRVYKQQGLSRAEALRRIKMQMPLRDKIKRADIIIDNQGTLLQTERQVKAVWQKISRIKKKK